MKKNNDWKDRLNVVYSTNPDFKFDNGEEDEPETLEPGKQQLRISLDKRNSCLLYTSPSPRDRQKSRMPSSA